MKHFIDTHSYICDNSAQCDENALFLVTHSSKEYINDAQQRGAKLIHPQDLANYLRRDISIVGITGTNGKTTTAALIYSLLLDLGYKVAMQGTRGFFISGEQRADKSLTTPQLFDTSVHIDQACKENCDFFIMEVSSHAIAQNRIEGLEFGLKILTNITGDHLDYHKNMNEYVRIKNSFLSNSLVLINADEKKSKPNIKTIRSYGIENMATYKLEAYSQKPSLDGYVNFSGKDGGLFSSNLMGFFNLYNILAAVASTHILTSKPVEKITSCVQNFAGVAGRMEIVSKDPLIIIDFAHTHDGIYQALSSFDRNNVVSVVGAGGNRDKKKRPIMGKMAYEYSKRVYFTSDNPRNEDPQEIINDMLLDLDDTSKAIVVVDRKEAIIQAIKDLKHKEILVILGRGDESVQEVGGEFIPLNDKQIVLGLLQ